MWVGVRAMVRGPAGVLTVRVSLMGGRGADGVDHRLEYLRQSIFAAFHVYRLVGELKHDVGVPGKAGVLRHVAPHLPAVLVVVIAGGDGVWAEVGRGCCSSRGPCAGAGSLLPHS